MTATPIAFSTKDSASGLLNAGISAAATTIVLQSGNGANMPQSYSSTATSGGSSTLLNSTGILAAVGGSSSAMAGKWILNKTDGSVATIVSVATNALTCTRLLGGTDNTWDNSDRWCIDPFVATLAVLSTSAYGVVSITTSEEVLIIHRSTDTLTVASDGRAYNGTSANSFSTGDTIYLFSTAPIVERFKDVISVMALQQDTDRTTLGTAGTNITNLQTGAYHYVVTTGSSNAYVAATPALGALAAGNIVRFKANHTNTGASTLNVNGLGATAIKKNDGATALAANDIISGQIVEVVYEAVSGFFHMVSPIGTPATITYYNKVVYLSGASSSAQSNPTSATAYDTHTYTIPANDLTATVGYEFEAAFTYTVGAGQLNIGIMLGTTALSRFAVTTGSGGSMKGMIVGTAAAGASVAVRSCSSGGGNSATAEVGDYEVANFATNGTLAIKPYAFFDTSNGGNTTTCTMFKVTKISTTVFV